MKSGIGLAISAGANVALVVAAIHLLGPADSPVPPHRAIASPQIETVRVVTNLPPETEFVTNAFHWRQLESTNYDEYVANLRAVGCPDRTIRDIILAEVWARYESAADEEDHSMPFWANGPRRAAAERAREAAVLQLKTDLASLLQRLFGIVWSPEMDRDAFDTEQLICRALLGDATEEQYQQAAGWLFRTEEAKDEVRWRCRGVFLEEDFAELWRRRDTIERELRAILSPAQFEEFRARLGMIEYLFNGEGLKPLKPTAGELRQIALARTEIWPLGWEMMDLDRTENAEAKAARERAMDDRLCAILGKERFAEALLLRDGDYRSIHNFAENNAVSREIAHQLHEIQKLAREEVRRAREDKSLDAAIRTERIQAVAAAVAPQVNGLLGQKLFEEYLRQNGRWVTNANQL